MTVQTRVLTAQPYDKARGNSEKAKAIARGAHCRDRWYRVRGLLR